MSNRPYVDFQQVKATVSIPDALAALGLPDQFTVKANTLTGVCPLPEHKHGPQPNREQWKANVKDGVWVWHCFGDCNRGGDVVALVQAMTGYSLAHVRLWFAEHFAERLTLTKRCHAQGGKETTEPAQEAQPVKQTPKAKDKPLKPLKPLRFRLNLHPGVPYLKLRGVTPATLERYGPMGLCSKGVLDSYVAIPIYGYPHPPDENPLAYLGRWPADEPDEKQPRYRLPEGFETSRIVYGLPQAMDTADDLPLVVVEGVFKVFHMYQNGFPSTVATLGSSLSDCQAEILVGTGRPIVLMFDGDEAGQKGMRAAAGKLITRAYVRVVKLPDGTEPDDLSAAELRGLLPFALPKHQA